MGNSDKADFTFLNMPLFFLCLTGMKTFVGRHGRPLAPEAVEKLPYLLILKMLYKQRFAMK
ncbi:MAG: hypothetical protein KJ717_07870 [Proteobacteria bacterium]|nr:hypothetical protein [Pseudomonadota bacterium]